MPGWRVGIDIGGTFTDVVGMEIETGKILVTKVPSIPVDPSRAVAAGLQNLMETHPQIKAADIDFFAHGTTVATNATIEGKGAKSGLLITKGFRAIYDMRGGNRPMGPDLIDTHWQKPVGLVPQKMTHEIGGRLGFDGEELEPLDENAVRQAARKLKEQGVQSIAVCYLFSFINPKHEQRTAAIIREEHPTARVSLSSVVLPLIREYLRLSTTVLDAYVGPVVANYLRSITGRLREAGLTTKKLFIMQSNGGLMQIDIATEYPNQTLLSGPAAGVVFGAGLGKLIGEPNIVTFDVGGTSTDISVLYKNSYQETRQGRIHDQDIGTPMIQIRALGAGGGTIAHIGPDGLLKGGPQSAGADPGPACYGHGGKNPTVTDANIVLGYLNPNNFVGGRFKIVPELAAQAITDKIAKPLNLSLQQAALGIIRVVCTNIEVGLRLSFVERGLDPRMFALLAFGGGGPVLGTRVAKDIGIPRVIVPPYPGISCAMGLLQTDVKHYYLQTRMGSLAKVPVDEINIIFAQLEERARREAVQEGFDPKAVKLQRQLDMRYPFQGYELTVDCSNEPFTEADKAKVRAAFDQQHKEVYGTAATGEIPDIVNVRVMSIAEVAKLDLPELPRGDKTPKPVAQRKVLFDEKDGYLDTPIYDRAKLGAGAAIAGPAIIEQLDSTTVILPGQKAEIERYGNIIIEVSP
ncbi:MAG TPA: hydantoinase/oxoprolinase family protein [Stellaceae bacterium]|nr:hydantoinase/oxoprolinase family protein [Stellaceae bacterium]